MDREQYRQRLAARLRGARAESGLSQAKVKETTGISTSHLSRIENGLDPIDLEELLLLSAVYDVPLGRILEVVAPLGDPPLATRASTNRQLQGQVA